ncbi:MAG: alpha-D-ribose 1-methylphosphonate 5-triphosphate diphosphatase [Burkholderiaceae bacterium]
MDATRPAGSLYLANARLVLPGDVVTGSLHVTDGRIAALDSGTAIGAGAEDLQGDFLLPGLVEIHTDNFERHLMPRPKVHWAELPALLAHDAEIAAAGITTVFDALGVGEADTESLRGTSWDGVVNTLGNCTRHGLLRADHLFHIRCELPAPNTIDLFEPFMDHPLVRLISLMDHTPGQRQWENIDHARVYYIGKKGWSEEKFRRKIAEAEEMQQRFALPHRQHFVDYARQRGIALASHDDTTLAHVAQAHAEGVSVCEFPTTELAARAARERGMATVMGGPNVVRGGSHSGNVAASHLASAGLLDILSSDYVPGSLLTAALQLVDEGHMTLPQAIATVSRNPARAVGLHDRGEIAIGQRGDLVQVRVVEVADGHHHAVVRAVWREGRRVL